MFDYCRGMEEPPTAITGDPERQEWELLRRSIAMLPTGAWALRREQALKMLGLLLARQPRS